MPKPSVPKLKISFGSKSSAPSSAVPASATTQPASAIPKPKRKYTKKPKPDANGDTAASGSATKTKKRARDDDDAEDAEDSTRKQQRTGSGKLSLKLGFGGGAATAAVGGKIALGQGAAAKKEREKDGAARTTLKLKSKPQVLKLKSKGMGRPPPRPLGQGYDSEADDIEEDPAVEHQFVIRMEPGEDCDYLRKAITERTIGAGADVRMHFFKKDGRRAVVSIKNNHYAAVLVDLPCIIEGLKSWDRKSFYKVTDIHQMLLVTARIKEPTEALTADIPEEVDQMTWQYPHGLTPPLHWARKRRFRKRVSHRTIEAVEEEVERLLAADNNAVETTAEMFDPNAPEEDDDDEMDAEGEVDDEGMMDWQDGEGEDEDVDGDDDMDLVAQGLFEEFGQEDDAQPEEGAASDEQKAIITDTEVQQSPETLQPSTETPDANQTPAAAPSPFDDSDDESDEDDDELDPEELAAQQERAQLREEIDDIKKEIESVDKQIAAQPNRILQMKLQDKKSKLKRDLQLKLSSLGEGAEDSD